MNTDFIDIIKTRRSCRRYKPDQIDDRALQAVLEAGTYAPTSKGQQSPFI
ncbi:MAG: nitroreductase family protein, partial [Bacteroidales bacterium]|nr:nitroreductase family protein [Bacteroidales bacterium]